MRIKKTDIIVGLFVGFVNYISNKGSVLVSSLSDSISIEKMGSDITTNQALKTYGDDDQ